MSPEPDILDMLMSHVHSLDVGLPISWPNMAFSPPTNGRYLAVSFIPNGNERIGIPSDMSHRYYGMLQISVAWSLNRGAAEPMRIASQVAGHFPADLPLWKGGLRIRVTKDPDIGGPLTTDTGAEIPVTIEWECYA